jgi:hypothetical protein
LNDGDDRRTDRRTNRSGETLENLTEEPNPDPASKATQRQATLQGEKQRSAPDIHRFPDHEWHEWREWREWRESPELRELHE